MKRIYLFFILFVAMTLQVVAQQLTRQCHVADAQSDEPLPYVSVFVAENNSTISNHDGDFTVTGEADETVKISYVGYNTLTFKLSELPEVVKMEVSVRTLHQLTVMPIDNILMSAVRQLTKEYNKKSTKKQQYFCRMTSRVNKKDELTEAFIEAESAVNLRNLNMLNGRRGQMTRWGLIRPTLSDINLQHALEVGPMTLDVPFWRSLTQPLPASAYRDYFMKYYEIRCEVLQDPEYGKLYCLDMQKRNPKSNGYLVGKLYIKASTHQLLRFDGELTDMMLEVKKRKNVATQPVKMKININYTLRNGFTEVEDISCEIDGGSELNTQTILHNISNLDVKFKKSKKKQVRENMLTAVDESGYDESIWKYAGVIQRTKLEEELAMQQAVIDSAAITQDTGEKNLDKLIDRLRLFGQRIPQEKVFLHLDNTCYFLGDTIWYAAYSRQTSDGRPSTISNVLYVELLNNDGYVMERQVVKMTDGRGHGNFYLDPELYAGFYELRAYTRWQLNWGASERDHGEAAKRRWFISKDKEHEFFRDYDKLYSRVIPVYDKPIEPGAYDHDMTLRPLRRYFRKDPDKRKLELTLYPEGGNLVKGLPCRVAYEAVWDDGEWVDGTLTIDTTKSEAMHRGRGYFTITPTGKHLSKPVFLTSKGEKITAKWPDVEESGVSLKVDFQSPKWEIDVWMTNDLIPDSMAMTIMHEGVLTHVVPLKDIDKQNHKHLELHNHLLEPGVHQVTVFDVNGRVWADRLFFVTSPTLGEPTLSIEGMKDEYQPFEKITLNIQANDPDVAASLPISFAVRDAWNQDYLYDTGNMMTEMLLSSEIKGFIPQPEWYFESNDEEHRQGLDLLMMTQGWRRFSWHEMAVPGAWELTHPDEKGMVIEGSVEGYMSDDYINDEMNNGIEMGDLAYKDQLSMLGKNRKKEVTVHAELVEGQTLEAIDSEMMTTNGRFRLKLPDFYDKSILFLSAADLTKLKPGKSYNWIQTALDKSMLPKSGTLRYELMAQAPDYMVYVSQPWPRYATPFSWYQNHLAPAPKKTSSDTNTRRKFSDGTIQLNEVSIKAKRSGLRRFSDSEPALHVDAYDAYNNSMDAGFRVDPEFIVRGYIGDLGLDDPYRLDENGNRTSNISLRFGLNVERRAHEQGIDSDSLKVLESMGGQYPIDTLYNRRHLWSMERELSPGELRYYFAVDERNMPTDQLDFHKLENFYIYTDYAPRQIGSRRYLGSDIPETKLALYPYMDGGRRNFYRDRRYIIQGFSIADEFYHPNYSNRQLPKDGEKDYRRTLYWNPNLQLDEDGHATVTLYNTSRNTEISVSAEGMSEEGVILTGK